MVIDVDWSDEPAPVYANGARVLNTQREFALVFTEFMAFGGRGGAGPNETPRAKVVASLRLTPDVFFQLAAACATNWNQYVNRFGDPRQPSPKFQLVGAGDLQLEGVDPPRE